MSTPNFVLDYGSGPLRIADLRLPDGEGPHPVLLVVHGGYWRPEYDRGYLDQMCTELTARGYLTCNIEYHRTGQRSGGWPGTCNDVYSAVSAIPELLAEAAPGLADPRRIALLGHSAGGHLALLAAHEKLCGVIALAPVCDLTDAAHRRLDNGAAQEFMGGEPADRAAKYAEADPMLRDAPPTRTVLIHGDADDRVPVEFSTRYGERTGAQVHVLPGADHFQIVTPGTEPWQEVLRVIAEVTA